MFESINPFAILRRRAAEKQAEQDRKERAEFERHQEAVAKLRSLMVAKEQREKLRAAENRIGVREFVSPGSGLTAKNAVIRSRAEVKPQMVQPKTASESTSHLSPDFTGYMTPSTSQDSDSNSSSLTGGGGTFDGGGASDTGSSCSSDSGGGSSDSGGGCGGGGD